MKVLINEHVVRQYPRVDEIGRGELFIQRNGSIVCMVLYSVNGGNRVHDAILAGNTDGFCYYVQLVTGKIGSMRNCTEVQRYDGTLSVGPVY